MKYLPELSSNLAMVKKKDRTGESQIWEITVLETNNTMVFGGNKLMQSLAKGTMSNAW